MSFFIPDAETISIEEIAEHLRISRDAARQFMTKRIERDAMPKPCGRILNRNKKSTQIFNKQAFFAALEKEPHVRYENWHRKDKEDDYVIVPGTPEEVYLPFNQAALAFITKPLLNREA